MSLPFILIALREAAHFSEFGKEVVDMLPIMNSLTKISNIYF